MLSDPIADLLTRITNARLAKHRELRLPHSSLKEKLAKLLVNKGLLGSVAVVKDSGRQELLLKEFHFSRAKRLSKPGMRLYAGCRELKPFLRGRGETVVSTSKGLLTVKEAYKQKLGGELICKIV